MTASFEVVQRSAAMLAEALLGRRVRLDVADAQSPNGRRPLEEVVTGAELVIVLPPEVAAFAGPHADELDRRAFRHAVVHQAAYELFGTRSFDVRSFFRLHADRPQLPEVFAAVEERRLDTAVVGAFPGSAEDVARVQAQLDPPLPPQVARALDGADLRGWSVEDAADLALALCMLDAPTEFVAEMEARELAELLDAAEPDTPPAHRRGGGDEVGDHEPLLMDPLGHAADVDDLGEGDHVDGAMSGGLPDEAPRRGRSTQKKLVPFDRSRTVAVAADGPSGDRSFLYDEWDVHAGRYLPAWCRVHERPLAGGDPAFIVDVRRRHAALARQVRRQFGMITPESWRRVHRELDGHELDLDEVIAAMVDRRRGILDDEHLHVRQVRAAREVAAAFLLDMSASTSSPVPDPAAPAPTATGAGVPAEEEPSMWWTDAPGPTAPERSVLDCAKEALALMCDALAVLGDEHAIYGFSGQGRDGVEFYVAKELHEASSARTWARLAAMKPRRYTRMGPAIRHATAKLRGHQARTRFLVVVSDGYPQDHDYGPQRGDKGYGIADTAKALEEAERAGVLTFCVTVDPAGHDYLREMCPDERYLVIDDVRDLPDELTKVYRTLAVNRR